MTHPIRLAVPAAVLLALGLAACGGDQEPTGKKVAETTSAEPTGSTASSAPTPGAGEDEPSTIPEYLEQAGIEQTSLTREDDGPVVDLPVPEGWSRTEEYLEAAPYGGMVLDAAADPADPPRVLALLARMEGDADPARILEYAPGELLALDGLEPIDPGAASSLGGYDAVSVSGTLDDGTRNIAIAQKTVVIPTDEALYVLQLNAYAPVDETDALAAALTTIDERTTITP